MRTEFIRAVLPRERQSLIAFDHAVFPKSDRFEPDHWKEYKSFWLRVSGKNVGCCALAEHVDFQHDVRASDVRRRGSLYIASTGILPAFQSMGLGTVMKAWQVAYARHRGFTRIVTNTRKGNAAMVALNRKFGFRKIRTTPDYYDDPAEPTVVMELLLRPSHTR